MTNNKKLSPPDWQKHRLGDLGKAIIGLTYKPEDVINEGGSLVFRSSNVKDGRVNYEDQVRVKSKIPSSLITREGDILICARNGSRNLIGKNAYITNKDAGNTFGAFMTVFRADNPRYFYHLFQSQLFKKEINKDMGPTINQVTTGHLHSFKFLFPGATEQKRIVAVLETWDRAIERLAKKIEVEKNIKKGLLQRLLTGKLRLPGFSDAWQVTKLGKVIESVGTRNKKLQHNLVLSVTNKNGFVLPGSQFARVIASEDLSNYKVVSRGEFAYNPSRINVGSIARLDKFDNGILSPMYVVFKTKTGLESDYLLHWIYSAEAKGRIKSCASGSVRESVDYKSLASIKVKLPSVAEQIAIVKVLNMVNNEIDLLDSKLNLIRSQKKYLLNNLITGTIRTPDTLTINV